MWFLMALVCLLGWGFADLFYKRSSEAEDKLSHLKIAVWVGFVMGVCAIALLPFSESGFSVSSLLVNAVNYFPASLCYIISMVIGYAGLRYLELSIISPVQNSSGALSAICICIWFLFTGRITDITEEFSILDIIGTVVIVAGVIMLAVVEHRISKDSMTNEERKLGLSVPALVFPLLYCVFDTIGTAADGIILDETTGLGLGEIDVIVLYGLTFFVIGIAAWFVLLFKEKRPYNAFAVRELKTKGVAACFEEFGQVFYVFAMAMNPVVAAPMIGSYCIVSVLLSRVFLKEKLKASQYVCVITVIAGIVMLGISEGLAELM